MAKVYQSTTSCSPSQQANSYIYAIIPVIEQALAAITSSDELILLDRRDLSQSPILRFPDVPRNVSCLVPGEGVGNLLLCSGGDGTVATFDVRTQSRISYFKTDKAITALACAGTAVALGTEYANHQAVVSVWDTRQNRQIWQNPENSDDVTALNFHPSRSHLLLAGGDDGQVSIFDTRIAEEDDSLFQGASHGPVHKAGFLGENRFFVLSSDQNLSIYPVSDTSDNEDPPPTLLGDLRAVIPCEYVIDVFKSGDGYAVAAGSNNSNPRVDILELRHATNLNKEPKLRSRSGYTLEGAHGEEVVRSIFTDDTTGVIYTAGEDGQIKAFSSSDPPIGPVADLKASSKHKRGSEGRYKPY